MPAPKTPVSRPNLNPAPAATEGRKPWKKKSPVEVVLDQADKLKAEGYWIYGLDERGKESYDTVVYNEPCALVVGAEGRGLHDLVAKHCDVLVSIPMSGAIASLNVSVATAVALFDWKRRRKAGV